MKLFMKFIYTLLRKRKNKMALNDAELEAVRTWASNRAPGQDANKTAAAGARFAVLLSLAVFDKLKEIDAKLDKKSASK